MAQITTASQYTEIRCNITYTAWVASFDGTCNSGFIFSQHGWMFFLSIGILVLGAMLTFGCCVSPGWTCLERIRTGWGCRKGHASAERVTLERKEYSFCFIFSVVVLVLSFVEIFPPSSNLIDKTIETKGFQGFQGFAIVTSCLPVNWAYIEGHPTHNRQTKTKHKMIVLVGLVFVGLEWAMIQNAVDFQNAPSFGVFVATAILYPVLIVLFCSFYHIDAQATAEINKWNLIELQQQQEHAMERVTNPLEQAQFQIQSSDLTLLERIGAGGNGFIYKATLGANTIVAAKEIITALIDPDDIVEFEHEARMLTQMNHPCVLRVFGFCTKTEDETDDHSEHKYIVTEMAPNGSLEHVVEASEAVQKIIQNSKSGAVKMPFTKLEALEWAIQIASGMAFLHGRGFVHRDIKPQNILLNKSNDALVADLGTVRQLTSVQKEGKEDREERGAEREERGEKEVGAGSGGGGLVAKSKQMLVDMKVKKNTPAVKTTVINTMTGAKGTPLYMAPEQAQDGYGFAVDVWAFGVTLVRLFTLQWPYPTDITMRRLIMGKAERTLVTTKVLPEDVRTGGGCWLLCFVALLTLYFYFWNCAQHL